MGCYIHGVHLFIVQHKASGNNNKAYKHVAAIITVGFVMGKIIHGVVVLGGYTIHKVGREMMMGSFIYEVIWVVILPVYATYMYS